jgi:hypothetical protein
LLPARGRRHSVLGERAISFAGAFNPNRTVAGTTNWCCLCMGTQTLGLRPGGGVLSKATPKGTTPFCSTVESTRPPIWWPLNSVTKCACATMAMKKKIHKNPRLTVVLPPPVYAELWKLADSYDVPVAWIIRRAVEHYLGGSPIVSVQNIAAEKLSQQPVRGRQEPHRNLRHY